MRIQKTFYGYDSDEKAFNWLTNLSRCFHVMGLKLKKYEIDEEYRCQIVVRFR